MIAVFSEADPAKAEFRSCNHSGVGTAKPGANRLVTRASVGMVAGISDMPTTDRTPPPLRQSMPRRRRGYIFPILLAVIGAVFLWQGVIRILATSGSDGVRLEAPGEQVFQIQKPGDYRLWLEAGTVIDGTLQALSRELPPGARVEVTQLPAERRIDLRRNSGSMSTSVNGVERIALATVNFPEPAEYRLAVDGTDRQFVLYLEEAGAFWQFFVGVACLIIGGIVLCGAMMWGLILIATATRGAATQRHS